MEVPPLGLAMPVSVALKPKQETPITVILREEMGRKNLRTFASLADLAGVPPESLSRWRQGRAQPCVNSLSRLAVALRADPEEQRRLLGALAAAAAAA